MQEVSEPHVTFWVPLCSPELSVETGPTCFFFFPPPPPRMQRRLVVVGVTSSLEWNATIIHHVGPPAFFKAPSAFPQRRPNRPISQRLHLIRGAELIEHCPLSFVVPQTSIPERIGQVRNPRNELAPNPHISNRDDIQQPSTEWLARLFLELVPPF